MGIQLAVQSGIYGYGIFGRRAEKDLEGTLSMVKAAGYDGVEVMSSLTKDPKQLNECCVRHGLSIVALHLFWEEIRKNPPWAVLATLDTARLIISGLPLVTEADLHEALDPLCDLAEEAANRGVRVLVHNHAEECAPFDNGLTPLEILVESTDDDYIGFVVDLHWAAVAGEVERTIKTTSRRCDYYHIKDGSLTNPNCDESYDLGSGEVDLHHAWGLIRRHHETVAAVVAERSMPAGDLAHALAHDAWFIRDLVGTDGDTP
ncbi:sugar phosphate isomerase/epimerase family protein [Mycobacterium haemophilum]|uniref:Uncharacterized protein n=1 Tax=Mycobacterium haemophilum TaxID=29311 RepID=A0A0I9V343_9MYCO|nr:sugar phosphate isomerase/epimerase [Mycobacterium haemophilum]KLO28417.1 hypothetical protein ABH39_14210 [Mycobacterium haemophilum]KLO37459.1 hypothetical protein ABH38_08675 [Mycobacterium haemophilum]KLO44008.1 hypothetical protein ABH37_06200 [Mycobacterium haemophilum]KLO49288.1 hypothetical protein ABH36_13065 [Mycobacterium haemophilum]